MDRTENLNEDFLQSEILLYCIKKCILRPEISPSLKLQILFLLFEKCKYVDSKEENVANLNDSLINPIGVDNDLIEKPPESLTADQAKELRKLMLEELRRLNSFCYSMRTETKHIPDIINNTETTRSLFANLNKQISTLNQCLFVQKKIENVKFKAYSFLLEKYTDAISLAKSEINEERKLCEEIVEAMTNSSRGKSLLFAEQILESKIDSNREKIEQLKFELVTNNIQL